MRILIIYSLFVFSIIIVGSCGNGKSEGLTGKLCQCQELDKVLNHFEHEGDTRKMEAATFLIRNMTYKYHFDGAGASRFNKIFYSIIRDKEVKKETYTQVYDSIIKNYPDSYFYNLERVADCKTVKAAELIRHIDAAFEVWKFPWTKELTFDEFLHYILPYTLVNEKPENWNQMVLNDYKWLSDSMGNSSDSYKACLLTNRYLKNNFEIRSIPAITDLPYSSLREAGAGKCYHATQYTCYVMRALGLPVVMDFTPAWGNMNGGHNWNALIYKGKSIPFVGSESDPGKTKLDLAFQRKKAKVYRFTYDIQENELMGVNKTTEAIPQLFRNYYLSDVTSDYIPTSDVSFKLYGNPLDFKFVYLCVFNFQKWTPVAWAQVEGTNATFRKVGREIVYVPMFYDGGTLIPAGCPITITRGGKIDSIKADTRRKIVVIKKKGPGGPTIQKGRKYNFQLWDRGWKSVRTVVAEADSILLTNQSENNIYWITSEDKVTKERIFTFKDGKQIWW